MGEAEQLIFHFIPRVAEISDKNLKIVILDYPSDSCFFMTIISNLKFLIEDKNNHKFLKDLATIEISGRDQKKTEIVWDTTL